MAFSDDHVVVVSNAAIFQEDKVVLSELDFTIEKENLYTLIGRTGSGKSSLLKTLYADLQLRNGVAEVVGYNLSNLKSKEIPFLRKRLESSFRTLSYSMTDRWLTTSLLS